MNEEILKENLKNAIENHNIDLSEREFSFEDRDRLFEFPIIQAKGMDLNELDARAQSYYLVGGDSLDTLTLAVTISGDTDGADFAYDDIVNTYDVSKENIEKSINEMASDFYNQFRENQEFEMDLNIDRSIDFLSSYSDKDRKSDKELSNNLFKRYGFAKDEVLRFEDKIKNNMSFDQSINSLEKKISQAKFEVERVAHLVIEYTDKSLRESKSELRINEAEIQKEAENHIQHKSILIYSQRNFEDKEIDEKTLNDISTLDVKKMDSHIEHAAKTNIVSKDKIIDKINEVQSKHKEKIVSEIGKGSEVVKKYDSLLKKREVAKKFATQKIDKKLAVLAKKISSNDILAKKIKQQLPKLASNIDKHVQQSKELARGMGR